MRLSAVFRFEVLTFVLAFSATESQKSHRLTAPLCKGSCREAGEGLLFKRQKPQLSAFFQSRRLLPSRLRVPPSSRRKATVTNCTAADLLPAESTQKFIRGGAAQNLVSAESQHPSVACGDSSPLEKRAAYRCPTALQKAKMCRLSVPQSPSVTLTRATFLPEEGSWQRAAVPQKKSVQRF